jgi:RNA polymerase sigma factor (TIGR02999 family)
VPREARVAGISQSSTGPFPERGNAMTSPDDAPSGEITQLVARWSKGDEGAFERLIELVYDDLRRIAHRHLALGAPDAVLDTTVLVHEAYLRLAGTGEAVWPGRAQFFAFCSTAMRHILIDFARRRKAEKRGGTRVRVPLVEDTASVDANIEEILVVEDALARLEKRNARMARIVECRYFGGMSNPETAEALDLSVRTVEREWARAKAYLRQALGSQASGPEGDGASG